jgi:hypothetical protein
MPASLDEAFGDNYETYPAQNDNNQMKKRKKPGKKMSEYGQESQRPKYLSSEPKQTVDLYFDDNMDGQYLKINQNPNQQECEYGPTYYNIKPKDVVEYVNQLDNIPQNFTPNNVNSSTNYIIDQNSVFRPSPSYNDDEDNFQTPSSHSPSQTQQQQTQQTPQQKNKMDNTDPRLLEFNAKLDLILQKLGHFDEPAQENIHDIILFVIFGVFVIFILDSVYRVGKMTL